MRLQGLRVAVDVQHLYRSGRHAGDRGTVFTLANGAHVAEADAALIYAQAIAHGLTLAGCPVLTNGGSNLVGPYSRRNLEAARWGANVYLACHVNAGGGSYALVEAMTQTSGETLGKRIGQAIVNAFPAAISTFDVRGLHSKERGAVCIERCEMSCAAMILEPFFGDTKYHQALFLAPNLWKLGGAVADTLVEWWLNAQIQPRTTIVRPLG